MSRATPVSTILMATALLIGSGCAQSDERARTSFTVEGMHCDSCSSSIVATLEKVDGVEGVTADHDPGMAEAVYRPEKVDADVLKAEIEKLGFTVTGMKTETIEGRIRNED
jgi:copper chaperone CopZ